VDKRVDRTGEGEDDPTIIEPVVTAGDAANLVWDPKWPRFHMPVPWSNTLRQAGLRLALFAFMQAVTLASSGTASGHSFCASS